MNSIERDSSAVGLDLSADTESGLKSSRAQKVWDAKRKKMVGVQNDRKVIYHNIKWSPLVLLYCLFFLSGVTDSDWV